MRDKILLMTGGMERERRSIGRGLCWYCSQWSLCWWSTWCPMQWQTLSTPSSGSSKHVLSTSDNLVIVMINILMFEFLFQLISARISLLMMIWTTKYKVRWMTGSCTLATWRYLSLSSPCILDQSLTRAGNLWCWFRS